jgi:murein DD-endopeptidase MepM/ murein hydrolase activator NlpD
MRLVDFAYAPLRGDRAAVQLLAELDGYFEAPTRPSLVVRRARLRTAHPAWRTHVEELSESALWVVHFVLPLEIVQSRGSVFTLSAPHRIPLALPRPLADAIPALAAPDGNRQRLRLESSRRSVLAVGTGVAIAVASAGTPTLAAAATTSIHLKHKASFGTAIKISRAHRGKHKASVGTAIKVTRPNSSSTCDKAHLSPSKLSKGLGLLTTHGVASATAPPPCDVSTSSDPAHKHRHHHGKHQHPAPSQRQQSAGNDVKAPAPVGPHPQTAAPDKHVSGGVVLPKPTVIKPHAGRAKHVSGGVALPKAALIKPHIQPPQSVAPATTEDEPPTPAPPTIWTAGSNLDPFTAAQLQHFSTLVAKLDQPPRFLVPIYEAAGKRYNIQWQILAAINAIETNYGRDLAVSPKGAVGWMQFMPGTWLEYGMAVGARHRPNPYDPRDAIFSAARYLAANGAPRHIRRALFAYNHALWYVDSVLWRAQLISDFSLGKHGRKDGYALPLDARYMRQLGRTDDGVDIEDAPDGAAVYSITPGIVTAVASDPTGFGPDYPVVLATKGPLAGQYIYYGHVAASLVHVGQRVMAGEPIAVMGNTGDAASLGHGHIEIGFSDGSGDPLNHHGATAWTPSGDAMRHVLLALVKAFRTKPAPPAGAHALLPAPSAAAHPLPAARLAVARLLPIVLWGTFL